MFSTSRATKPTELKPAHCRTLISRSVYIKFFNKRKNVSKIFWNWIELPESVAWRHFSSCFLVRPSSVLIARVRGADRGKKSIQRANSFPLFCFELFSFLTGIFVSFSLTTGRRATGSRESRKVLLKSTPNCFV